MMTRDDYFRMASAQLRDEFIEYLDKLKNACRSTEEAESATERAWRTFEREEERLIEESWRRINNAGSVH